MKTTTTEKNDKINKKLEIIKAAKKLIIKNGYRKTSVEDITKSIGIAKGSFYTYFNSKADLIIMLIEEKSRKIREENSELFEKNLSLEETMREYSKNIIKLPFEDPEFFLVMMNLFRSIDSLEKEISEKFTIGWEKRQEYLIKTLERYRDDLDIEEDSDIFKFSMLISGCIDSFHKFIFFPVNDKVSLKSIREVKKVLSTINLENEIEFMTKSILKLILKK